MVAVLRHLHYTAAFWLTLVLLRRRSIGPRSVGLWCWAVVCGWVAASFVPLGTALALPCLFMLFLRRSLFFQVYFLASLMRQSHFEGARPDERLRDRVASTYWPERHIAGPFLTSRQSGAFHTY